MVAGLRSEGTRPSRAAGDGGESETAPTGTGSADGGRTSKDTGRGRMLRPVLWRLHFLSGFLVAPVVVSLALTGLVFAWNPQIEAALYRDALSAVSDAPDRPLGEQIEAAAATHPEYEVTAVVPAAPSASGGEETTAVTLTPPDPETNRFGLPAGETTVYVDPGSAEVTGEIVEANRPDEWIRNLHSNWRVGERSAIEPLSELAAGWVLVSLLTGLYLFWPRSRRAWARAVRLRPRGSDRARWRLVHTTTGALVVVALLTLVVTGLTWTEYAGRWVDVARAALSSPAPTLSTDLEGGDAPHGEGHHGGDDAGAEPTGDAHWTPTEAETVVTAARAAGVEQPLQLTPPSGPGQAWTAAGLDSTWPIDSRSVAVDPAGGRIVDRLDWDDQPLLGKATTWGIHFHSAELFGVVNQILLTLIGGAVLVLIVSGYRMWWRRRPPGGLGAPPKVGPLLRTVPVPLLIGFGILMVLLPMLGVSFVAYLVVERVVAFVRRRRAEPAAT